MKISAHRTCHWTTQDKELHPRDTHQQIIDEDAETPKETNERWLLCADGRSLTHRTSHLPQLL